MNKYSLPLLLTLLLLTLLPVRAVAQTRITDLRVEHRTEPSAVEETHPSFSWKMESSVPGQRQTAYRIKVRRTSDGRTVWDSGDVRDSLSTGIRYLGMALQPATSYEWDLNVTDRDGKKLTASSRFSTGLMDPRISAWKGAMWIGDNRPSMDAASLHMFSISSHFMIVKGSTAGFIFGADDFRLKNIFCNDWSLAGENYFKVMLDFSDYGKDYGMVLYVFRVGYAPGDSPERPLLIICKDEYPGTNINQIVKGGPNDDHSLKVTVCDGTLAFTIDGQPLTTEAGGEQTRFQVSRAGTGHDINTFPNLCSVGFTASGESDVTYTGYRIEAGGQSESGPLFFGAKHYTRFESLSCIRLPKYRNQSGYENDIVVVNKSEEEVTEYIDPSFGGAKMLRSEFSTAGKKVKSARLFASALGVYNFYVNGKKVGDDWFAPGASQYRETVTYQAYDVTSQIRSGKNAIGAELFEGWYSGYMTYDTQNYNFFGDVQALLCRLDIEYDDGTVESVVSRPESWKSFDGGPVRAGSFFQGERYDATLEAIVQGWSEPGYNDRAWKPADRIRTRSWVNPFLRARHDELVRVRETRKAVEKMPVRSADNHTHIYNMGVNMVGVPEIHIPAGWLKRGDVVTIRYAEQLYPGLEGDPEEYIRRFGPTGRGLAGHLLFETNRTALNTDFYIAAGSGEAVIRPRSTWRGYQYIQITIPSHEGALPLENVKGLVLSSCEVPTGRYQAVTGNKVTGERVNKLFTNIQRSQMGNFFTLPTDCPQRNERMGWTGDAQVYCRTATYNADVFSFFRQWMTAVRDDQGIGSAKDAPGSVGNTVPSFKREKDTGFNASTTWAAAVCMVPWQLYNQYGDTRIIEDNLDAMMSWLNGMAFYPLSDRYPYLSAKTDDLGDWLAMDERTPSDLVNNAIYIHMMEVTAKMAEAVGRNDYARILRERRLLAIKDWNQAYVDPSSGKTRSLNGNIVHTQTSYATPLNFNVFNDANQARAAEHLATLAVTPNSSGPQKDAGKNDFQPRTITTGFSGTPNILPALSRAGRWKEAYSMFICTSLPSWLYPVTKGATSVWERWNGYDGAFSDPNCNSMNSFNHFALGSVGQWMYEYQLGISPGEDAGYKHFVLQPMAGGAFVSLEGSFESEYGRIGSSWTADPVGIMSSYTATVPANTSATLYLPVNESISNVGSSAWAVYTGRDIHDGIPVAVYELTSGTHHFSILENSVSVK